VLPTVKYRKQFFSCLVSRLMILPLVLPFAIPSPQASASEPMWGTDRVPVFTEIRAFLYDPSSSDLIVSPDNELNPSRSPKEGVALSPSQAARLESALVGTEPSPTPPPPSESPGTAGTASQSVHSEKWAPRNGFVFYDSEGKILGKLDICFASRKYMISLSGGRRETSGIRAGTASYEALANLCRELGVPPSPSH
jgi:hypothetical protein